MPGGFTRVAKLALPRKGDCAPMAIIELTHQPAAAQAAPPKAAKEAQKPQKTEAVDAEVVK